MTDAEHAKLQAKLDGQLEDYIIDFDLWVNENPNAKTSSGRRKDRHAYETISAWFRRDAKKGGRFGPQKTKQDRTLDAANRLRSRLHLADSRGGERGTERGHPGHLFGPSDETEG